MRIFLLIKWDLRALIPVWSDHCDEKYLLLFIISNVRPLTGDSIMKLLNQYLNRLIRAKNWTLKGNFQTLNKHPPKKERYWTVSESFGTWGIILLHTLQSDQIWQSFAAIVNLWKRLMTVSYKLTHFQRLLTTNNCSIKIVNDWIQTADLWFHRAAT